MTIDNAASEVDDLTDENASLDVFDLAFGEHASDDPKPADPAPADPAPADPAPKTEAEIRADILKEQQDKADLDAKADNDKQAADALALKATLTEEEQKLQAEVTSDFPDVTKIMAINQRIADAKFEAKMAEFEKRMDARMAPVIESTQAVASNAHEAAILDKHKDAFDVLPAVHEWIGKQPDFLQATYSGVLEKGTSKDVIALFDTYKGTLTPETAPEPTADEIAAKATKDAADKEAARVRQERLDSMSGVKTDAITRTEGVAENDFEGGFNASASSK